MLAKISLLNLICGNLIKIIRKSLWEITVTGNDAGKYRCKSLILCIGFASKQLYPNIDI